MKESNQEKIDFVKRHIRIQIDLLKAKYNLLKDTPACYRLAYKLDISSITLINAFKGDFTQRTVSKMIEAGWFTEEEYLAIESKDDNEQETQGAQDAKRRERAAYQRGYNQGFNQGLKQGSSANSEAAQDAYNRGFEAGRRQSRVSTDGKGFQRGIDIQKLESLFNMTVDRGAAQGEMIAARKAAGITIAKWIKEKFGQDVKVNVS